MKKIAFTLILASAFGSVFAQNLLVNGSFEQETAANGYSAYALQAGVAPDGWTFVPSQANSDASALGYGYYAADGVWGIGFAAYGDPTSDSNPAQSSYDSLQQAVQTVAGDTYTLTYWLEDPQSDGSEAGFVFNATWNGSVIAGTQMSLNVPTSWTQYTATVSGTGGMDVLGLNGYDGPGSGYMDDVSLVQNQAVPAPAGVIALGIGLLGLTLIRRKSA